MKVIRLAVLLLSFLGMIAPCDAAPSEIDELALFERARELLNRARIDDRKAFAAHLRAVHDQLHKMVESNELASEGSQLQALYLRGMSGRRLLGVDRENGQPIDIELAKRSVADLDAAASVSARLARSRGISPSEATYSAAFILSNYLKDEPRSFTYFERCADLGNAGCLNVVAGAAQYGRYGQKVDLAKAARYHKKVVQTGTLYRCAGSYSARSIGRMVYFDGVVTPEGDELYWARVSMRLARAVVATMKGEAACNIHGVENDIYLYQLSRGAPTTEPSPADPRPDKSSGQTGVWAFSKLILGAMSQEDFDAIVAEDERARSRCGDWLNAAWLFALRGNDAATSKYRSRLLTEDEKECEMHRRYIGKIATLRPASPP